MPNINEIIDSINDENAVEVLEKVKSAAKELDKSNKQLYARAKKAEGFELKDGKWVKPEKREPISEPEKPEAKQPSEPDYGKLAYLKAEGVSHPDDRKLVLDEANRLKLPIEEVLGMAHIKAKLVDAKTQREAESGMPQGKGKTGGGSKASVEHWIDATNPDGTYKTPPDPELHQQVIDARLKREQKRAMFDSDDLWR